MQNGIETFDTPYDMDNGDNTVVDSMTATDDWTVPVEEEESADNSKEEKSVDTDSQVNNLEEEEDAGKKDKEKEAEEEEESEKSDDSKDEDGGKEAKQSKDGESEKTISEEKADNPEIKTIRAIREGKAYEVPKDAELKVKIDGKNVKVKVQELMDNYSGQQSWDKKFSELTNQRKEFEVESKQYKEEREVLARDLTEVKDLAMAAMRGDDSPLAFVEKMLDFMGVDAYDYSKNLREYLSEETSLLNQLSPEQREAYWVQQKNEHLLKKQESLLRNQSEQQARVEQQREVDQMREAQGISQEVYSDAYQELTDNGYTELEPSQIIEYIVNKPLAEESVSMLSPYMDQIDDEEFSDIVKEMVTMLKAGTSKEVIEKILAEEYEVETVMNLVDMKEAKKAKPSKEAKSPQKSSGYESFDDFGGY